MGFAGTRRSNERDRADSGLVVRACVAVAGGGGGSVGGWDGDGGGDGDGMEGGIVDAVEKRG